MNPANSGRFTADSFLGRAASTAIGVAGGALLFEGISHLFTPGESLLGGQPTELVNQTIINEAPQVDAGPYMGDVSQGNWLADDSTTPFIDSSNFTDSSWAGSDFSDNSFSGDFDSDW
ncbi:DUF2076 family protein [Dongshaea marina]|uniref:DUF2076 family protein n=1 Tax=Dongshaea marina TaxID=2047966 RepID=UPI002278FFC4|nr:DUF2076 family protein [Dongshaea marina]